MLLLVFRPAWLNPDALCIRTNQHQQEDKHDCCFARLWTSPPNGRSLCTIPAPSSTRIEDAAAMAHTHAAFAHANAALAYMDAALRQEENQKVVFLFLSQSKKSELAFLLHDGACATRAFIFPSQAAPHPDPAQNAANMREQFIDFIRRGKNPTLKCRKQVSFFLKFCFLLTLMICAACRAP